MFYTELKILFILKQVSTKETRLIQSYFYSINWTWPMYNVNFSCSSWTVIAFVANDKSCYQLPLKFKLTWPKRTLSLSFFSLEQLTTLTK